MDSCVFCKIVAGEIPALKILEDDWFLAILDINPATKGHALVISKIHATNLYELPEEHAARFLIFTQRVARAVAEESGATGLNLLLNNGADAGQSLFHFHAHIIPRHADDGIPIILVPQRDHMSLEGMAALAKRIADRVI